MHRVLKHMRHPDARLPLIATLATGLLVGFAAGAITVKDREHTHLLRQISTSVDSHSCSGWAADAQSQERKDEVYRAVAQALIDWDRSNGGKPGN